jgi:carboxyl-terminal processing protease
MKVSNILKLSISIAIIFLLPATQFTSSVFAQNMGYERDRGRNMLEVIKKDIEKNYYDPNFHGIDIETRFKTADEKIKQATSLGQIFGIIAQVLLDFNDSHLFFVPPNRSYKTEYGFRMQIVGDKAFVISVKPGSDAEAKGAKPGDEIYSLSNYAVTRDTFWKIEYYFKTLRPQPGMELILISPDRKEKKIVALAKVTQGRRVVGAFINDWNDYLREVEDEERSHRHRHYEVGDDVFIWKMPRFDLSESEVDDMMNKVKKRKALILDLRNNGGGSVSTVMRLIGNVFDHNVKVGDLKRRKETKPSIAKTRGTDKAFKGKVIVLIDSNSGSASEVFARVVQLEKRGVVIGDRSAGAVMQSRFYPHEHGIDVVAFYGVSVTDADIIMSDGKSLERIGVTPDEIVLPSAADLAAQRDPVLARAATLAGITLTPEKAGQLFPIEWR